MYNYEMGLKRLLEILGPNHQSYIEVLTLQHRLLENMREERMFGSTETFRGERARLISALNRISITTLQVTFNDLSLDAISPSTADSIRVTRRDELISLIRESYAVIREYEGTINLTSDPKEKIRAERLAQEQRRRIEEYITELNELAIQAGIDVPTDITQIASRSEYSEHKPRRSLTAIRQVMVQSFSLSDLRILCFDLGVDFDNLSGESKDTKLIALLEYLHRRSRIDELMEYIQRVRPNLDLA